MRLASKTLATDDCGRSNTQGQPQWRNPFGLADAGELWNNSDTMQLTWIRRAFKMTRLTLELALRVIDGALARATDLGCPPLTVVVLDAGGHDIALKRQ